MPSRAAIRGTMARSSRPRRLVTAAGPSRIHTGVPCLPAERSCERPATRVGGEVYRSRGPCQRSLTRRAWAEKSAITSRPVGKRCRSGTALPSSVEGRRAPRRTRVRSGPHGIVSATGTAPTEAKKTTSRVQARSRAPPIAPMSPGHHRARRATRGRQQPEILRVTEWLDRPAAKKFVDHNLGVKASRAGRAHR